VVALVVIVCIYCGYKHSSERLYFAIDKFETGKRNNITIGQNSDIVYEGIVPEFMSVSYDGVFNWRINEEYLTSDSLYYFKVNDENPSVYTIKRDDVIRVNYNGQSYPLPYDSIYDVVKGQKTEYYSIRNILKLDNGTLKSLIYVERDYFEFLDIELRNNIKSIQIIILDRYTYLNDTIGYRSSGTTNEPEFKLQFFSVTENQAKHKEKDTKQMFVGDVNYYVKPMVLLTAWGAGHIMMRPNGNHIEVTFPKAITFSESIAKIDSLIKNAGSEIVIKQKQSAFSTQNDIYLPAFSCALPTEVCQIERHNGQDKIHIRPFNQTNDSIMLKDDNDCLPAMDKMISDYGEDVGKVYFRTRNLNSGFYLSGYTCLSAIFILVILGLFTLFYEGKKCPQYRGGTSCIYYDEAKNWVYYLSALFTVFYVYMCCKIFIATKLSFSYPFFEKIYPVGILSASLQMLLLFALIALINYTGIKRFQNGQPFRPFVGLLFPILVGLSLVWFWLLPNTQNNFMDGAMRSYKTFFLGFKHVLSWHSSISMNDNHTTVYYTLIVLIVAVSLITSLVYAFAIFKKKSTETKASTSKNTNKTKRIIITLLALIAIAIFSVILPGNFSALIITPLIIVSLSSVLNWVFEWQKSIKWKEKDLFYFNIPLAMLICACFLGVTMLGDAGYLTNFIGFILATLIFFALIELEQANYVGNRKEWTFIIVAGFMVVLSWFIIDCAIPKFFPSDKVNYERYSRRLNMFTDFESVQKTGFRYNESDAEFMVALSHYMHPKSENDIFNEKHHLHPSVSTGQSPVVLNDVSFPAAFYAPLRGAAVIFFLLQIALFVLVLGFSIGGIKIFNIGNPRLHIQMRWRILAVCMWVGTSLYIFASYLGFVPFTGRLIPGFGVDAVGEAVESVLLFTFMGAMIWKLPKNN
jgi:hypothetical protein